MGFRLILMVVTIVVVVDECLRKKVRKYSVCVF